MENKFKPIAMKCNEAQFKDIEPILKKNGGMIMDIGDFKNFEYLINYYCGEKNHITNVEDSSKNGFSRTIFEEWNKDLFLKSCGIEEETDYTKYIGRKVKGFRFKSHNPSFVKEMESHINEIGVIVEVVFNDRFKIKFKDDWWNYPAEETLKHLIEEEPDVLTETPFHKPDFSHLGKFVNLSSVKEKKETKITHYLSGDNIWLVSNIKINDPDIKKIFYHGQLDCGSDFFVAEIKKGLVILKGIVGDEFKLS